MPVSADFMYFFFYYNSILSCFSAVEGGWDAAAAPPAQVAQVPGAEVIPAPAPTGWE